MNDMFYIVFVVTFPLTVCAKHENEEMMLMDQTQTQVLDSTDVIEPAANLLRALEILGRELENQKDFRGFSQLKRTAISTMLPLYAPFSSATAIAAAFVAFKNSTALHTAEETFEKIYDIHDHLREKITGTPAATLDDASGFSYGDNAVRLSDIKTPHMKLISYWKTQTEEYVNARTEVQVNQDAVERANAVLDLLTPCRLNRTDNIFNFFEKAVTDSTQETFFELLIKQSDYDLRIFDSAVMLLMVDGVEALTYSSICVAAMFPGSANNSARESILSQQRLQMDAIGKSIQKYRAKLMYEFQNEQLEIEVKGIIENSNHRNPKVADLLNNDHLSLKYDWFQWGVVAFRDVKNKCQHLQVMKAQYSLFGFYGLNVAITWSNVDEHCSAECAIKSIAEESNELTNAAQNCQLSDAKDTCSKHPVTDCHRFISHRMTNSSSGNLLMVVDPDCYPLTEVAGNIIQHVIVRCQGKYSRSLCTGNNCVSECHPGFFHVFHAPVQLTYANLPFGDLTAYEDSRTDCCLCEKQRKLPHEEWSEDGLSKC